MKWHNLIPFLKALWHRPAGPMNWKNPIRVMAVVGWLVVQGFVLLGWAEEHAELRSQRLVGAC